MSSVALTSAADRSTAPVLNLAITAAGLLALGLDASIVAEFAPEFVTSMTDTTRSRMLGDVGDNSPAGWRWGGPPTPPVHLVAMLFATDDSQLTSAQASLAAALRSAGLKEVIELDTSDMGDREPFGFHDSISQPIIEGLSKSGDKNNTVPAGEFVLGYPNGYGLYTDRPILPTSAPGAGLLPRDPAGSGGADLGRNGTYLIMRQLRQDVTGFWHYLQSVTRDRDGQADAPAMVHLGARLVGRWPGGAPLVLSPDYDDPALSNATDFLYHGRDPEGIRCPFGAHVRRSNPRDSLDPDPGSQASIDVGNRHRLLRRGREYGPVATTGDLTARADDGAERGLQFVCLSANISRQFEFVQHTWVNNPKFDGLYQDPDPLVARHDESACFTIPRNPVRTRLSGLPQFVTVVGGAYFFLPGINAIRYLANLGS